MEDVILPMAGFEHQISGVRSEPSINYATTTAQIFFGECWYLNPSLQGGKQERFLNAALILFHDSYFLNYF